MSKNKDGDPTSQHRRLPSFSELILSFGSYSRQENTRPKALRSSSSELLTPTTQPAPGGDLISPKSKIEESVDNSSRTYSYGHRDFRYGSYRFPTERLDVVSPAGKQRPMHSKSISLPNIGYTDISEESTRINDEEDLLSSLGKMLETSSHSNDMRIIRENYLTLVEQAPERIIEGSKVLHGYITSSNQQKFITHESVKQFILKTSPHTIDNLIIEYNDNIATLTKFKAMILQYTKEEDYITKRSLAKISSPKLQPPTVSSPPRKSSTSNKTPSKRRKASLGTADSGSKTVPTVLDAGGSIVPLEIKKPTLYSGSSTSPIDLGAVNPDLSVRQEIRCNHCGSKSTPEWRKGLDGNRTLCNACGLFYSKLAKKYNPEEAARIMRERKETGSVNNRRIK